MNGLWRSGKIPRDHPISAAWLGHSKVHIGTGRASPACLGPPNLGGWMGFAEAGNRYQLFRGSRVRTNSAMALERWESCGLVGSSLRGFWRVYRPRAGTRGSCLPESSRIRGRQGWGKQGPAHVNKSQRGYMGSRKVRAVPTCRSNSHWRSNTHTHIATTVNATAGLDLSPLLDNTGK